MKKDITQIAILVFLEELPDNKGKNLKEGNYKYKEIGLVSI